MPVKVNYGTLEEIQMEADEVAIIEDAISKLPDDGLMVEWGSGGSTYHWLSKLKPTQRLISIEHNLLWYNKVNYNLINQYQGKGYEYIYKPSTLNYNHGYANPNEEHPIGLEEYLNPKDEIWNADLFYIDGIARGACSVFVQLKKKKENPMVFMHDYGGRELWYKWATQLYSKTEQVGYTLAKLTF